RDADGASFGAQASSATIRASGIPAEAAKENADVQLVLLALQPGEKTFYAFVIVFGIAFKNQAALFGRELTPRHVRGNSAASRSLYSVPSFLHSKRSLNVSRSAGLPAASAMNSTKASPCPSR